MRLKEGAGERPGDFSELAFTATEAERTGEKEDGGGWGINLSEHNGAGDWGNPIFIAHFCGIWAAALAPPRPPRHHETCPWRPFLYWSASD
jgi:hypothetical protein